MKRHFKPKDNHGERIFIIDPLLMLDGAGNISKGQDSPTPSAQNKEGHRSVKSSAA